LRCGRSKRFSGRREIRYLGVGAAAAQRGQLLGAEAIRRPDQTRLVRVQDPSGRVPDLHAHDRGVQDVAVHARVQRGERRGPAAQHAVGQLGRDDALAGELGLVLGVADRLTAAGALEDLHADQSEHGDGRRARHGGLRDSARHRRPVAPPSAHLRRHSE
jgi:hypothetical protein